MMKFFLVIILQIGTICYAVDPPKGMKWEDTYNSILAKSMQRDSNTIDGVLTATDPNVLEDSLKYFNQDSFDYKRIRRQMEGGRDWISALYTMSENGVLISPLDLPTGVIFAQMNHWKFLNEKVYKGYLFFDSASQRLIGVSMLFSSENLVEGKTRDYSQFLQKIVIGYTEKYGNPDTMSDASTLGSITSIVTKQAGEGKNWLWLDSTGNLINIYSFSRIAQSGWLATSLMRAIDKSLSGAVGQSAIIINWRTRDYNDRIKSSFKDMKDL